MPRIAPTALASTTATRLRPGVARAAVEPPSATAPDAATASAAVAASSTRRIFIGSPSQRNTPARGDLPVRADNARKAREGTAETCLEREELDAAGDVQADAGDVAREIGAQKGDRVRDVLRLADAAQRRPLDHPLVHLRVAEMERLAADDPGDDRVDGDPVPRALERQGFR